jgi:hypothetical protein
LTVINQFVKERVKIIVILLVALISTASYVALSGKDSIFLRSLSPESYQLGTCQDGFYYRDIVMSDISDILNKNVGTAGSYFASKGLSEDGLSYLLLVNYETSSLMVTYRADGGLKAKPLTRKKSNELIADLVGDDYNETEDYFGGESFHGTCDFIRLNKLGVQHEIKLFNAPLRNNTISSLVTLSKVRALIDSEYMSIKSKSSAIHPPAELTKAELDRFESDAGGDLFHELRVLKLKKL